MRDEEDDDDEDESSFEEDAPSVPLHVKLLAEGNELLEMLFDVLFEVLLDVLLDVLLEVLAGEGEQEVTMPGLTGLVGFKIETGIDSGGAVD